MRAVYLDYLSEQNCQVGGMIVVDGESAHHLTRVVRIKCQERVLLLNGNGLVVHACVQEVRKSDVLVKIVSITQEKPKDMLHLALGMPKKDSVEEILRMCVEIGISKIIPISSHYAQLDELGISTRTKRIMESAAIQANNPFLPTITDKVSPTKLAQLAGGYEQVFCFCSIPSEKQRYDFEKLSGELPSLILIGPEAGFSPEEESGWAHIPNIFFIHLPTYILRATSAVAVASGYVLSKIKD